jgi:hypothetical protein
MVVDSVTGSLYADYHCYPTAGYIVSAAGATDFPEFCAVVTQRRSDISVVTDIDNFGDTSNG